MRYPDFVADVAAAAGVDERVVKKVFTAMRKVLLEAAGNLESVILHGLCVFQPRVRFSGKHFCKQSQHGIFSIRLIPSRRFKGEASGLYLRQCSGDN